MSHFAFLQRKWPDACEAAVEAEAAVRGDSRTTCFYARRALELLVAWMYKHDAALKLPYQENLSALIHEPSFKLAAGEPVFSKARVIATLGNRGVHSHRAILSGKAFSSNQIEFVNLIVNYLTEHGVMDASLLYESPFTDLTPQGPDGIFSSGQVDELLTVLDRVRATAVAA
jgi:type I site-specific restriction endonuclease